MPTPPEPFLVTIGYQENSARLLVSAISHNQAARKAWRHYSANGPWWPKGCEVRRERDYVVHWFQYTTTSKGSDGYPLKVTVGIYQRPCGCVDASPAARGQGR